MPVAEVQFINSSFVFTKILFHFLQLSQPFNIQPVSEPYLYFWNKKESNVDNNKLAAAQYYPRSPKLANVLFHTRTFSYGM